MSCSIAILHGEGGARPRGPVMTIGGRGIIYKYCNVVYICMVLELILEINNEAFHKIVYMLSVAVY